MRGTASAPHPLDTGCGHADSHATYTSTGWSVTPVHRTRQAEDREMVSSPHSTPPWPLPASFPIPPPPSISPHRASSSPKFGSPAPAESAHSHPTPNCLKTQVKSHLWGEKVYSSCLDMGSCDEDRLEHSCRGSQLQKASRPLLFPLLLPLPLPCSWRPRPPDQAAGSSSGLRDSPPPPPPSRALRFFDISLPWAGALGVSVPTPGPPPSERRVKVGLGGGE